MPILFTVPGGRNIAIVNKAKTPLGFDLRKWVEVHQHIIDNEFGPAWGRSAKLSIASAVAEGVCNIILLDKAEQGADFEGYHEVAPNGWPRGFCFMADAVKTDGARGASTLIGHELFELIGDPYANAWRDDGSGVSYAEEPCDACEDLWYQEGGIYVTDWLTPAFFYKPAMAGAIFDKMRKVVRPFQTLHDGYQTIVKSGAFKNIFGSQAKADRFALEDRDLHRSTYRTGIIGLPMLVLPPGSPQEEAVFQRASRE